MHHYHIIIGYSAADAAYIAQVPDLEQCSGSGQTPEEALAQVQGASATWLATAAAAGTAIPQPSYRTAWKLEILVDGTQITGNALRERATRFLQQHLPGPAVLRSELAVELTVDYLGPQVLRLALVGSLEAIALCYVPVSQVLTRPTPLRFVRSIDEAGDELRQRAHIILLRVEHRLRAFINHVMLDSVGFTWWHAVAPPLLQQQVQAIMQAEQGHGISLDPVECTPFDALMSLFTTGGPARPTEERALWGDLVVSQYVEPQHWATLQKAIRFVLRERVKVLHRRPLHFGVVQALLQKEGEINALLDTAKPGLADYERSALRSKLEAMQERAQPS